ncbi:hypothetical protein ACFX2C_017856 [Malus domestica]
MDSTMYAKRLDMEVAEMSSFLAKDYYDTPLVQVSIEEAVLGMFSGEGRGGCHSSSSRSFDYACRPLMPAL